MKLCDSKRDCCGCSACISVCKNNAIILTMDRDGFYYPYIDNTKCINCGMCLKVCAFRTGSNSRIDFEKKIFAAKNHDKDILLRSSSGGVFFEISSKILEENGIIYGAAFNENLNVQHIRVTSKEDLVKLMGSKYVQSVQNNVFSQLETDLLNMKKVLYSGTPCQVNGLYSYLNMKKIDFSNLLTVDLICHGVPSNGIFLNYIKKLEHNGLKKIVSYTFRNKESGNVQAIKATFSDGKVYEATTAEDSFYKLFLYDYILRPSCYNCPYASMDRIGDITIGDFWGYNGNIDKTKGISIIIINSSQGSEVWKKIENRLEFESSCVEQCKQGPLYCSAKMPKVRNVVLYLLRYNMWGAVNIISLMKRIRLHLSHKRDKIKKGRGRD